MRQLNTSSIMLAFFAILFGLAGTYMLRVYRREPPAVVAPPPPEKKIVRITVPLASRDIASGTQITLDDVALYKMTREEIQEKVTKSSFMTNPKQIIGKILLNDMKSGRPFKTQDFYPTGTSPGIAKRLGPGLRAMTIVLDPTNALMGFAGPGQKVDVLFHFGAEGSTSGGLSKGRTDAQGRFYPQHHDFNAPTHHRDYWGNSYGGVGGGGGSEYQQATSTLVQDAEILALGKKSVPTDAASGLPEDELVSVTLAVRPHQAELIRVAEGHGELSLTLRGPEDSQQLHLVDPVTLKAIFNVKSLTHEMEVYRGTTLSKMQFSGGQTIQQKVFANTDNQPSQATPAPVPTFVPVWPMAPGFPQNYMTKPVADVNVPTNVDQPNGKRKRKSSGAVK